MALTLVATVAGASSNSYVTQAAATTYLEGRLGTTAWTGATSAQKDAALVMATNRLEQEEYVGSPSTLTQRLKWPRDNVPDPWGNYYAGDAIPRYVQEATAELALHLLQNTDALDESGLEPFERVKVGPLDVTPRHGQKSGALPQQVIRLLMGLRSTNAALFGIERG